VHDRLSTEFGAIIGCQLVNYSTNMTAQLRWYVYHLSIHQTSAGKTDQFTTLNRPPLWQKISSLLILWNSGQWAVITTHNTLLSTQRQHDSPFSGASSPVFLLTTPKLVNLGNEWALTAKLTRRLCLIYTDMSREHPLIFETRLY
jgi:hypothetical protein